VVKIEIDDSCTIKDCCLKMAHLATVFSQTQKEFIYLFVASSIASHKYFLFIYLALFWATGGIQL
jgi:hypothetical protein